VSSLREYLYILVIGIIIYLSMFLWGRYHTAEQNKIAQEEFALLKHPVTSQYDGNRDNAFFF